MVFCYLRVRNKTDKNMKKIVIIIIAIMACINANAQWKTTFIEADEFLGVKAAAERGYYIDADNDGITELSIVYNDAENTIRMNSVWFRFADKGNKVMFKIGLYNNDKLVENLGDIAFDAGFKMPDQGCMSGTLNSGVIVDKIIKHLINGGSIRIYHIDYEGMTIDIKVPAIM